MERFARILLFLLVTVISCGETDGEPSGPDPQPGPDPEPGPRPGIYRIPVVVHVVHEGDEVGQGHNLSKERIAGQIRILNEDYRRQEGTPGFNSHPDGADSRIEFALAKTAPDGSATDGIVRIDAATTDNPVDPNRRFDHYAYYSYWDPEQYLNVWTIPLPESAIDVFLGEATGPETDLPGAELLLPGEPVQAEGAIINAAHFGESNLDSEHSLGRTLTHEIGHYLGLLHPWGGRNCEANDHCDDTPAVSEAVTGGCDSRPRLGCQGEPIMVENYMNYVFDRCMNVFTNDQVARMRYVLENSPRRNTLIESAALDEPG